MPLKNVLLAFSIILFVACNNTAKTEKTTDVTNAETLQTPAHEERHDTAALSLNNGAKWQTDESTRRHAAQLNAQVDEFAQSANPDLPG